MKAKISMTVAAACLAAGALAAQFDGVDLAPGDIRAKDLCALANVRPAKGDPIVVVKDGEARLAIVYADADAGSSWAAGQLQKTIFGMTGVRPKILCEKAGKPVTNAPAFYIGATTAATRAALKAPADSPEAYRVVTADGSVYLLGRGEYAVPDFCERVLGTRFYFAEAVGTNKVCGKSVIRTRGLAVPPCDWDDRPVFTFRANNPYEGQDWNRWAKGGSADHRGGVQVHAPTGWWREKDATNHLEIFANRSADGKVINSPLLCYGNPATVEYYKKRVTESIERHRKDPKSRDTSGVVNLRKRVVTVSQWDCGVYCSCKYCSKLFDPKLDSSGSGSPIIWGYFTRELAKWLKEAYPDYRIAILPYKNTCDVPPDPEDPSKPLDLAKYGNVEAQLCTMPGLAMLKNRRCKAHEEELILRWARCTGNRVLNWHYSCWPSEFTTAPYVFGETIQKHYSDLVRDVTGSFINGGYGGRLQLSVYVWMRCLWNPEVDVHAVYDGFAERMFGRGAKPMRELIAMQETGWNRQWDSDMCSMKNIHKVSYPPADVKRMVALLDEAAELTKADAEDAKRVSWYRQGFDRFLKESAEIASGTAFEPFVMKKADVPPKIDGKLDDPCWAAAPGRAFVNATDKKNPKPQYATEVKAVWYPGETGGVTFSFRCEEPSTDLMAKGEVGNPWSQDNTEIFIDASGAGDGHFYQILTDSSGRFFTPTDGKAWKPKGIRTGVHIDNGWWSMEVFLPFSDLKEFPGVRLPTTSALGICWTGNFNRWRVGDMKLPKEKRAPGSKNGWSRLFTRHNFWNKDPSAFGEFKFEE